MGDCGMIAITLLTLFLGIAPLTKLSPVAGYVTAAVLAFVVLIFVFNIHEYISIGILYLIYAALACGLLWAKKNRTVNKNGFQDFLLEAIFIMLC